jgi:hypothetical protein
MKKSRFTDSQIVDALKRVEAGLAVPELCNDPADFAQVRLLISMIDRFVPVFSCPGLDEAGVGCKTQSIH